MTDSWHSLTPATVRQMPVRVRPWVTLTTSMTARVGAVAHHRIDVEVLRQTRSGLHADERRLFATSADPAVVREVCLSAAGRPLLIARTVFTSRRLQRHPAIVKLGNKALGSLLFAGPAPCPWTVREFARIDHGHPLFSLVRWRHSGPAAYWGRRTLFRFDGEPLLVTEIMLPDLLNHPDAIWPPAAG